MSETPPQTPPGSLKETISTVFYAVLIALFVRTLAYEPFNIPSGSMLPTLMVGDYLFVSKFSYGYSTYSLPFNLNLFEGRVFSSEPERGDVAVFKLPTDNKTDYIKRIVGLPGDKIQMINGRLHVNGKKVGRRRIDDYIFKGMGGNSMRIPRFTETLPNGVKHSILEESDEEFKDNTMVYIVPKDHYFGMGDNRDHSKDSRYLSGVGFIPKKNLVGRAEFLFFSIDGGVWSFWNWPWSIRFNRIFKSIV